MSNSKEQLTDLMGIVSDALGLIQVGVPVAREAFHIIQIAKVLAQRVKNGEEITDEEIEAATKLVQDAGNDLLNTD